MASKFKHGQSVQVTLHSGKTFTGRYQFALDGRAVVSDESGVGYEVNISQIRALPDEAVSA